jgi:hypothetical protein
MPQGAQPSVNRRDVVIRQELADGVERFVFYVGDEVAQFAWSDKEAAVRKAIRFATNFHVSAWLKTGEREYLLLKGRPERRELPDGKALHLMMLNQLRGQFLEMPGLALTVNQAERLCGIDASICKAVLDALVDARILRISHDGRYRRAIDGR